MLGLKSSVSHLITPAGPPPRLIFDRLEPRMLMTADPVVVDLSALQPTAPTHEVVVRLINEVSVKGDQAVSLERVETVDAGNPAKVLDSRVVSPGSTISVIGGHGDDKITIDLSSLPPGSSSTTIDVLGRGGTDTLRVIEQGGHAGVWHLDQPGAGQIDDEVQVVFTGIEHIVGSGADTLLGSTLDTNWTIDAAGAGKVGETRFEGFANLIGPTGRDDVFTVTATGSLNGFIDGGGLGTLIFDTGDANSLLSKATGAHGCAIRRDHHRKGPCAAIEFRRLPDDQDQRGSEDRGSTS